MNKEESMALYNKGREAWNAWAEEMLAQQAKLKEIGKWEELPEIGSNRLQAMNAATQDWLTAARSDFSELNFENEVDFSFFVFPGDVEFADAKFANKAQFLNATFRGAAGFGKAGFGGEACFLRAEFFGDAKFGEATFSGDATFREAAFRSDAEFGKATFSGQAWFSKATFSGTAGFGKAGLGGKAWFPEAEFIGNVKFGEATFSGDATFSGAAFRGDAEFGKAECRGDATFIGATFRGDAGFGKAGFSGDAWFDKTKFIGDADFGEATFWRDAWFDKTKFSGDAEFAKAGFGVATFSKAKFSGNAEFGGATFRGDAMFWEAEFRGLALFREVNFWDNAWFNLAVFESFTDFSRTTFENAAGFLAIKGQSLFTLRNVEFISSVPSFEQGHFAEAPGFDSSHFRALGKEPDIAVRWRALRRLAIQGHDHQRELDFFANEVKAMRGVQDHLVPNPLNLFKDKRVWPNGGRCWAGLFYQIFSNFGRSTWRPFFWWLMSTASFALYYLSRHLTDVRIGNSLYNWGVGTESVPAFTPLTCIKGYLSDPAMAAIYISVQNGLVVSGLGRSEKLTQSYACLYGSGEEHQLVPIMPDAVVFAGLGQTVLSAVLIFLFLLALRNYFRIK